MSSFLTLSNRRMKVKSKQVLILGLNPMAGVKNNDVNDDFEPATMMQLSYSTRTSYDILCSASLTFFPVFDVHSQELFEALGVSLDNITGWVHVVLRDPLYNMRRVQGRDNVE